MSGDRCSTDRWRTAPESSAVVAAPPASGRCRSTRRSARCGHLGEAAKEEVAAGTAIHAAWAAAVKARHNRGVQLEPSSAAAAGVSRLEPALVPRCVALRPFRSHVVVRAAEVEFCMACFCRAPRYHTAVWRAECCDGASPIAACPRHIPAAVVMGSYSWLARHTDRGVELKAAAMVWQSSQVFRALRPPQRRLPASSRPTAFPER